MPRSSHVGGMGEPERIAGTSVSKRSKSTAFGREIGCGNGPPIMPDAMPDAPSSPRARILVVDDEASLRRIAQYRLSEAGYEVELAEDGAAALAALAASPPDLAVTDLKMPGLPGEELGRA